MDDTIEELLEYLPIGYSLELIKQTNGWMVVITRTGVNFRYILEEEYHELNPLVYYTIIKNLKLKIKHL